MDREGTIPSKDTGHENAKVLRAILFADFASSRFKRVIDGFYFLYATITPSRTGMTETIQSGL